MTKTSQQECAFLCLNKEMGNRDIISRPPFSLALIAVSLFKLRECVYLRCLCAHLLLLLSVTLSVNMLCVGMF